MVVDQEVTKKKLRKDLVKSLKKPVDIATKLIGIALLGSVGSHYKIFEELSAVLGQIFIGQ